jgi:predicted unusual protein kinase regulating ubiquinone biosynthesis (AarF/ABC1/UbiB family)
METSPNIPEKIVKQFKNNFNAHSSFDKIVKPEICDILVPTNEYRNPWFNDENRAKVMNENIKNQLDKQNKLKRTNESNRKMVLDFINLFVSLNNREPMETEIIDNLKEKIEVNIIKKIIEDNKFLTVKINGGLNDEFSNISLV